MFISQKFIFLELEKTGSSHIRLLLNELFEGILIGKHKRAPADLFTKDRSFLGSIRDPWDLYVSLWSYYCRRRQHRSLPHKALTILNPFVSLHWAQPSCLKYRRHVRQWPLYQDHNDAKIFRKWLRMMHETQYFSYLSPVYGKLPLNQICGFMTFRYLWLFCTKHRETNKLNPLLTVDQIWNYEQENCLIDHFIRNEHLESDLLLALENIGLDLTNDIKSKVLSRPKTNVSQRKRDLRYYYDAETENLVAQSEWLIIKKFGYTPPSTKMIY